MANFNYRKYQRHCERIQAHKALNECFLYAKELTQTHRRSQIRFNTQVLTQEDQLR
jgi:hypothetical protein